MQKIYEGAYLTASRLRNSVEFLLDVNIGTNCNAVQRLYTRFSDVRKFCERRIRAKRVRPSRAKQHLTLKPR